MGAVVFKDTGSEATGRLVLGAIDALGVAVTPEMASPLFAAIATDTGWFRFNSVTALTFAAAGRLVHSGANRATSSPRSTNRTRSPACICRAAS